ncbi:hypothetical protein FQA39_LY11839 [Lamprigera yunnana]|nr:hypothetical protein FQA39_LY11839 [Lamprigera yunnana]
MARKYITDEELQKIIEDSDFEIDETLQSEDDGWESSSEEEDNMNMQEEHSDTKQTSSNSENSDSDIDVQDDLKIISKSEFQWDSLPPKSSKRILLQARMIATLAFVPIPDLDEAIYVLVEELTAEHGPCLKWFEDKYWRRRNRQRNGRHFVTFFLNYG